MPATFRPPRPLVEADFSRVRAVFTDVDGTLTSADRLESATLAALERLQAAGLKVVLVSGRPAGWGEAWARQWPVDAVVVENGGLWFLRDGDRVRKDYAQPERERNVARRDLLKAIHEVQIRIPEARLSSDSRFTEVDMAFDHHEEARLPRETVDEIERLLRARGVTAVRSSVHVNCWIGAFDKLFAVRRILEDWGESVSPRDRRWLYVGDSFNDAPMFGAFPLSVGVANVRDVLDRIEHAPKFVTKAREGAGFREVARAVLRTR